MLLQTLRLFYCDALLFVSINHADSSQKVHPVVYMSHWSFKDTVNTTIWLFFLFHLQ
jgi:hypothetical protein